MLATVLPPRTHCWHGCWRRPEETLPCAEGKEGKRAEGARIGGGAWAGQFLSRHATISASMMDESKREAKCAA
jgi:hypothetical protein